ncbi:MAG: NRDE family protein [Lentisphaeria bacterium]|nr:NRDE family protein [Lentisphaeria bacterium]
MCTATWIIHENGYELFFNRDEKRDRPCALPPRVRRLRGVRVICPTDTQAGGTWLAVNQHGLAVGLLNHYPECRPPVPEQPRSRGQLVLEVAASPSAAAVEAVLSRVNLAVYQPFTLLALARGEPPVALNWNGKRIEPRIPPAMPLTSSSFATEAVAVARRAAFEDTPGNAVLSPSAERLIAYHRSHLPSRGPYSVCMHRQDARTVSFSHIKVTAIKAVFEYETGPPCRALSVTTTSIRLTPR